MFGSVLSTIDGCFLYVARLTETRAIAQAIAPGTVGPKPKGVPHSFQPTQTAKPAIIAEIIPCFVAFFQYNAANAGSPAAAA